MKTINLYFDFEFTSLSPDAQPISLGIVSDENITSEDLIKCINEHKLINPENSFYAELSDFDISRCDDWVKEKVLSKLTMYGKQEPVESYEPYSDSVNLLSTTEGIKQALMHWLHQFSDYQITFVCDCGTFDWYWMLQLLAEWENSKANKKVYYDIGNIKDCVKYEPYKIGLPKLPANISPVPQDLNDLILSVHNRKGLLATARDAFNANRENLLYFLDENKRHSDMYEVVDNVYKLKSNKHNALWDAKVIKAIYNKLNA